MIMELGYIIGFFVVAQICYFGNTLWFLKSFFDDEK